MISSEELFCDVDDFWVVFRVEWEKQLLAEGKHRIDYYNISDNFLQFPSFPLLRHFTLGIHFNLPPVFGPSFGTPMEPASATSSCNTTACLTIPVTTSP